MPAAVPRYRLANVPLHDNTMPRPIVHRPGALAEAWLLVRESLSPRTEVTAAVVADQLRMTRGSSNVTDTILPLAAGILALAMRGWVAAPVLLGWVGTVALVCLAINLIARRLNARLNHGIKAVRCVARMRTLLTALLLTAWCGMGIVLWVPDNSANHMLLTLVLAVSLAGSASILAAHPASAAATIIINGGMLIIRPLLDGGKLELMLAGLGLLFTVLMTSHVRTIYLMARRVLNMEYERQRALRQLARAKADAEREHLAAIEAGRTKSAFLSNMNHELRTPMNAILGFSELIAARAFGDRIEKYAEYAELIHESGDHLMALINDMLDLSKIEGGKLTLDESLFSLRALVRETVAEYEPPATKQKITLRTALDSALPELEADRRAIRNILSNLLSNALKFTPSGGYVTVAAGIEPDGRIVIAVEDTGIGIPPEDQLQVFKHFGQKRHDVTMMAQGTGLGLAIVKGYAEAHDGEVTLDSAPGVGTRVAVRLPAARLHRPGIRAAE